MVNGRYYVVLVGVQRFTLLYATLYIPIAFRSNPYLWVSIGYASLAIGGFLGYLRGYDRWFSIVVFSAAVASIFFKEAIVALLLPIGMLHSIMIPMIYDLFRPEEADTLVARAYSASSIAYFLSGLLIYMMHNPLPLLASILLILTPQMRRSASASIRGIAYFIKELDFIRVIPYTATTFIVGGLYTVYLSKATSFGNLENLVLALSAFLMGGLRWVSNSLKRALWPIVAGAGLSFIVYLTWFNIYTAMLFITLYSLIYPLVTMATGRMGNDPVIYVNAAFAGVSVGESIMPQIYVKYPMAVSALALTLPLLASVMLLLDRIGPGLRIQHRA